MSYCMLSEKKKQKKLISANVIARYNPIVIYCDEQMQISCKLVPINVNHVTIKI